MGVNKQKIALICFFVIPIIFAQSGENWRLCFYYGLLISQRITLNNFEYTIATLVLILEWFRHQQYIRGGGEVMKNIFINWENKISFLGA